MGVPPVRFKIAGSIAAKLAGGTPAPLNKSVKDFIRKWNSRI